MKTKNFFLLFVIPLVLTSVLIPPSSARTGQEPPRGVGVAQSTQGVVAVGRYHALVIGNNAYIGLPRLKTAEADAREVAALLKEAYGFETKLLLNATRQQITSALNSYRRELGTDASLLVYYAGHGVNDKEADKAYWLPVDAQLNDTSNWIIADEITTGIRVIPARHVLVVSDSCYSGTLTRELPMPVTANTALRQQWLQKMHAGRSRTLMASGGNEPVADGGGGGKHSVFASALLRGLRQMEKEQFTAAELFREYVEVSVAGGAEQTPEYSPLRNSGHDSGDFVFARVKNAELTVKPPASPAAAFDPAAIELSFWESIKGSTDAEDFKAYLEAYPTGRFAPLARNNMRRLEAAKAAAPVMSNAPASNSAANTSTPAGTTGGSVTRPPAAARVSSPVPASMLRSFDYVTLTLDAAGKLKSRETKKATQYAEDLGGVALEMVEVPGGTFMMGSPETEAYRSKAEGPQHQVSVRGFYMGKYEVTQAQYQAVMGSNPSSFKGGDLPVEDVSWNDAVEFCKRLSAKTGREYRLPSEAEWEYAARAGTTTPYAFGERTTLEIVNCYGDKTMAVGWSEAANGFGLYDMHGNVWEWCLDYWHESYSGLTSDAPTDGSVWRSGGNSNVRVLRGGSHVFNGLNCRSASRFGLAPGDRSFGPGAPRRYIGFRVVVSART